MATVTIMQSSSRVVTVTLQPNENYTVTAQSGQDLAIGSTNTSPVFPFGEKLSSRDAGYLGQTSEDDDYLYVCTVAGVAGQATWKKCLLFKS